MLLAALPGGQGWSGVLVSFALAGFMLGHAGTVTTGTKVLPGSTGKVTVSGWIDELGPATGKRRRMVVAIDTIEEVKPQYRPGKARLSVSADHLGAHSRGDYVIFQGWLYPPLTPAMPGGWNYGRVGWFDGIGAGGRVASALAKPGTKPDLQRWSDALADLRAGIADRIRARLPEREAGFAVALITGERSGLDNDMREALQLSGLAHILAISGLHMSLVAGGVFWLVRALLALWPMLVLNYPVKKLAAITALAAAGFYLLISGQAIATQRAFIMLSVMFLAVLLGRSAISMRNLAVAAVIVLLIAPQAVLTPSFQMSFLAVMGLIAGYELLGGWQTGFRAGLSARPFYLRGLISRVVAGRIVVDHHHRQRLHNIARSVSLQPVCGLVIACQPAGHAGRYLPGDAGCCRQCLRDAVRAGVLAVAIHGLGTGSGTGGCGHGVELAGGDEGCRHHGARDCIPVRYGYVFPGAVAGQCALGRGRGGSRGGVCRDRTWAAT